MPNQFGGIGKGEAFGLGLLSSTLGAFKSDYDQRQAKEQHDKELDFEIIMKSINDPEWQRTHTPSQREYALEKAIDVLKPKDHQGVKEGLKQLFGKVVPYQPQAGQVLQGANQRPRLAVKSPEGSMPITHGGVTLPAMELEKTYGEMDVADEERKQQTVLSRQLAMETQRELFHNQQREAQNKEIRDRTKEQLGLKTDAEADLAVKRQLTKLGIFEDTPENRTLAAESLRQEREQKKQESQLKMEEMRTRIKKINEDIGLAHQRIDISIKRLGLAQQKSLNEDPQIKGAWLKVNEYKADAQRLRTQAAILYSKMDDEGAAKLTVEAEKAEAAMQGVVNNIEQRVDSRGVKLPSPPSGRRDPKVQAYADKYFGGDYEKADAYKKVHP